MSTQSSTVQIQMAIYTPLCLEVTGGSMAEGQTVQTYPCMSSEKRQQWSFVPISGAAGGSVATGTTYHIVNANSLQCMTVSYGRSAPGTPVIQAPCYLPSQASQTWTYVPSTTPLTTGYRLLSGVGGGLCLDIPYGETAGETPMQIFTCTQNDPAQGYHVAQVAAANAP